MEPLPPPGEFAAVLVLAEGGLRTAEVYAEADRLGLGRHRAELDAIAGELRTAAGDGESPLRYAKLLINDLSEAALSVRPFLCWVIERSFSSTGTPTVRSTSPPSRAFTGIAGPT